MAPGEVVVVLLYNMHSTMRGIQVNQPTNVQYMYNDRYYRVGDSSPHGKVKTFDKSSSVPLLQVAIHGLSSPVTHCSASVRVLLSAASISRAQHNNCVDIFLVSPTHTAPRELQYSRIPVPGELGSVGFARLQ